MGCFEWGACMNSTFKFNSVDLELVEGDITLIEVDAIVNAANPYLEHGGGVARAIVLRGGDIIQEESRRYVKEHGPLPVGGVAVTSAGSLKAKYVIHVVGPRWNIDPPSKLDEAITNALKKADELNLKSIAFPAISTGAYGYPYDFVAKVMVEVFRREIPHLKSLRKIIVCLYGFEAYNTFKEVFDKAFNV